ncbi:MAG: BamA/TamA family outer membrane protein [Cyanobacteria bacterium SBLK]|nr:BamA/TamA family outer membrane protein [Cyanobacteria bacterium SBLK]
MSTILNSLILRSSIAILGSTAINCLAAVENLGQEIQNISEDSIESESNFPSVSKQKKIDFIPVSSHQLFEIAEGSQAKPSLELVAIESELEESKLDNKTKIESEDIPIDRLVLFVLESWEKRDNTRDDLVLDELTVETANLSDRADNLGIAIAETRAIQEENVSPDINSTKIEETHLLPILEKVSFEAGDLIVQDKTETENHTSQQSEEVEREAIDIDYLNNPLPSEFGVVFTIEPTALEGFVRAEPVLLDNQLTNNLPARFYFQQKLGVADNLLFILGGDLWLFDPQSFGVDLSYFRDFESSRITFNFANTQTEYPAFSGGDREVNLPNGEKPIFDSLGGGIEYLQAFSSEWTVALGTNYRKVSIRDDLFSSSLEPVDELGNQLTVSDRGQDDLLTLNISALYNNVDDSEYPSRGTRIRLGLEQALPIGEAQIAFNRLSGNITQFIPLSSSESGKSSQMLVFNLRGGTIIGEVPPYEGFTLGGSDSIRGYDAGEVGTGRSFILATVEYRFPVASTRLFNLPVDLLGNVFIDYGSLLGTGDNILGQPGEVRQKPGDGLGFGIGLSVKTSIALFRFDLGFSDDGDSAFSFSIGERF